ncbi:outer membrane autotransporter barrel domain-containing protein [Pragia fontium DSM 5563 = ATCC 49100]|uniref:Outer membrane autotransporter barrel domain-containing protein n=1 Tax=Pragia fontium DSM 5563 = ATCC 49100 TaxID=1122977 RepID=A0AAJ4WAC1_9GAMM|nr:outer membrane autotransporter barrel domain-containing protein [Pragia fontium DSM 5563 = ATCC 49100]
MKLNKLVLALPALFAVSLPVYSAEVPPESFPSDVVTPDVAAILGNSDNSDGWPAILGQWENGANSVTTDNQYINEQQLKRTWFPINQKIDVNNNSYSLNNTINSLHMELNSGSIAIGNVVKGDVVDPNESTKVYKGYLVLNPDTTAYDTVVENNGTFIIKEHAHAYNTLVKVGGRQIIRGDAIANNSGGYAQGNIIDGGSQELLGIVQVKDTVVINGGQQIIEGGTAINSHIGSGSFQFTGYPYPLNVHSGLAIDTKLYDGAFQHVFAASSDLAISYAPVADRNTTVYSGARQLIQRGISEEAQVYGFQLVSGVGGEWVNGDWESDASFNASSTQQTSLNATIHAGGQQLIQTGIAEGTQVYGLQVVSGKQGGWIGGQWVTVDKWIGRNQVEAQNATIYIGGKQQVEFYGSAIGTIVDGGRQLATELGHIENTTVQNGGSSYIAHGAYSTGTLDIVEGSLTLQGGDIHSWSNTKVGGKGAWAENINLQGANSTLYIEHNAKTNESTATIKALLMSDGLVIFGRQDGSDIGKYSRLDLSSLSGNGTFVMNTNINGGQGDFLSISDPLDINSRFNVKVMDSGVELKRSIAGVDPYHLIYANSSTAEHFTLLNGSVDLGAYKYYLVQGDDTDTDNWYLSPTAAPVEPGDNGGGTVTPNPRPELSEGAKAAISMANVTPTIWDGELSTLRTRLGDLRDDRSAQNGTWVNILPVAIAFLPITLAINRI